MAKKIKTGGREQGTPNKLTKEMRAVLKGIVQKELENLSETIKSLEPDKRTEVILKLLPYVLPKVESVPMDKGEPVSYDWNEN